MRRIGTVRNRSWELTVAPAGDADVTLTLRSTASCTDAHAVCTADGRTLEGGVQMVIAGPAVLSVADASVDEAAGATLDFVVTLSKQRFSATTVDYATSDGTASEPGDYTATSGTLTFAALETTKTISVPVRDDAHDDGGETLTLTLSNASGARLGDAEATGTINNSDSMPKGWMTRFGRTIGGQVVDALGQRFAGANTSHVTLGGPDVRNESEGPTRARGVTRPLPGQPAEQLEEQRGDSIHRHDHFRGWFFGSQVVPPAHGSRQPALTAAWEPRQFPGCTRTIHRQRQPARVSASLAEAILVVPVQCGAVRSSPRSASLGTLMGRPYSA